MSPPLRGRGNGSALHLMGATVVARASGYGRVVVLASILGVGSLASIYGTANALPNMIFELLVGGGLRSVLVPTLVHEFERDEAAGWRTASAIFNVVVLGLTLVSLATLLAAPWIFRLLTFGSEVASSADARRLGTVFIMLMAPQVVFYGIDLVTTGVLNAQRRFVAPTLFVVAGNFVTVTCFVAYWGIKEGGSSSDLQTMEYLLLAGGTTAGVATIALAGLGAIRRLRPVYTRSLGRGIEAVRRAARATGWMFLYVLANQVGLVVVLVLGNRVLGGVAAYQYAFMLFMLPYTVLGLSMITTMLPAAASVAAAGNVRALSDLVSINATRLVVLLSLVSLVLIAAAEPIVGILYGYGAVSSSDVEFVASVLRAFAVGLVPFTLFQLLARIFYAHHDTRTPALVNVASVTLNIIIDLVLFQVLSGGARVVGLAGGHAASYTFAVVALWVVSKRRYPGIRLRFDKSALTLQALRPGHRVSASGDIKDSAELPPEASDVR